MTDEIDFEFFDHETRDEIDVHFKSSCVPVAGQTIVYWDDRIAVGGDGRENRHKMLVHAVEHNFRVIPSRGSEEMYHTVVLYVEILERPGDEKQQ